MHHEDHKKAHRMSMSKAGEGQPSKALALAEMIDRGAMWAIEGGGEHGQAKTEDTD